MLLTTVAFIVVLGITITVHEFGHFAMAKLLKIRVIVFSIGFGPRLFGFTRGGTEYRVSPIPIGGYVKMAGETFDQERQGEPDEFLSHPKSHRFLVAVAGPIMNILLAVAIFVPITLLQGELAPRYRKEHAVVGPVVAYSAAARAGLRSGDVIRSVRGVAVGTWEEMELALATAPRKPLDLVVERAGQRIALQLEHPGGFNIIPADLGFKFTLPKTVIQQVMPGSPAAVAGMRAGDEILSVRGPGRSGRTYDDILNIITESKGIQLRFEVLRRDETKEPPQILEFKATPVDEGGRVMLGFAPVVPADVQRFNFAGAVVHSVNRCYEMTIMTFRIIGRIFTGSASVRSLSGPIDIARYSGEAARTGSLWYFAGFLALISLNLGVFNLLPIPILDGGVIALLLVEALIRRDLSLAIKEKVVQVGFVFLILLMGFVVVNDLSKLPIFEKLFR